MIDHYNYYHYNSLEMNRKNSDKNISDIEVYIITDNIISYEENNELKNKLNNYLMSNKNNDISKVVENIYKIFNNETIIELRIYIHSNLNKYNQSVIYRNGLLDSCRFSINEKDDYISVSLSSKGTSVHYIKDGVWINDFKDLELYLKKINELQNLEKGRYYKLKFK